jgi:hypothetical protein
MMKNDQLNEFYSKHFISKMPSDTEIVLISRIIGSKRLVDDDTGAIAQNVAAEILVGHPRAVIEADRRQACGKAKDN